MHYIFQVWIHAGIATQAKIDQRLKEQGISRYDIGREKVFLRKTCMGMERMNILILLEHSGPCTWVNSLDYDKGKIYA